MAICMEELIFQASVSFARRFFSVQKSLTKKGSLAIFQGNCWLKIPLESWRLHDDTSEDDFPMATVVIVTSQGVAYKSPAEMVPQPLSSTIPTRNSRGAPTKNLNWGTGKHFIRCVLNPANIEPNKQDNSQLLRPPIFFGLGNVFFFSGQKKWVPKKSNCQSLLGSLGCMRTPGHRNTCRK